MKNSQNHKFQFPFFYILTGAFILMCCFFVFFAYWLNSFDKYGYMLHYWNIWFNALGIFIGIECLVNLYSMQKGGVRKLCLSNFLLLFATYLSSIPNFYSIQYELPEIFHLHVLLIVTFVSLNLGMLLFFKPSISFERLFQQILVWCDFIFGGLFLIVMEIYYSIPTINDGGYDFFYISLISFGLITIICYILFFLQIIRIKKENKKRIDFSIFDNILKENAIMQLAGVFHEDWRQTCLKDDGSYRVRMKETKDMTWIESHGTNKVDIANSLYEELPSDWKAENIATATVVVTILYEKKGNVDLKNENERNYVGSKIHDAWLSRNSWATHTELDVPFDQLTSREQSKDIDKMVIALKILL